MERFDPVPIFRDAMDHELGRALQVDTGRAIIRIGAENRIESDTRFGKMALIVEVDPFFKAGFGLIFEGDGIRGIGVIDFKDIDPGLAAFDFDGVEVSGAEVVWVMEFIEGGLTDDDLCSVDAGEALHT